MKSIESSNHLGRWISVSEDFSGHIYFRDMDLHDSELTEKIDVSDIQWDEVNGYKINGKLLPLK